MAINYSIAPMLPGMQLNLKRGRTGSPVTGPLLASDRRATGRGTRRSRHARFGSTGKPAAAEYRPVTQPEPA